MSEETTPSNAEAQEQATEEEEIEHLLERARPALAFLESIDPDELDLCLFHDELVTTAGDDGDAEPIGEYTASAERVERLGVPLILVKASSHGKVDGTPMGTSVTCHLNPGDLSVVQQEHAEYVKMRGHDLRKRTDMSVDADTGVLTVKREVAQGRDVKRRTFTFPRDQHRGFVTEGSNVLLQRLLVRCGARDDQLTFVTVDGDSGKLVPSVYRFLPERAQQVRGREIAVTGVERCVMSSAALPHAWHCYFMPDGHLTMRAQVGSPAVARVARVPRLVEREVFEPKPVFGKKQLAWEDDMEMRSRFLSRKDALKAGHDAYLRQHPEARALLADFFQHVLLRQPDDVVATAAKFFAPFSEQLPEQPSYAHSQVDRLLLERIE